MIKSSRIKYIGHVARMEKKRDAHRMYEGKIRREETTGRTKTSVDV
jgi:hypothetical protein